MLNIHQELALINERPKPFEFYTAEELWGDDYTFQMMAGSSFESGKDEFAIVVKKR